MKILLLEILYSQAFFNTHDFPVVQKVVASPEIAAIILWERNRALSPPEPGHNEAHLYELNLTDMVIREIEIPGLDFKKRG